MGANQVNSPPDQRFSAKSQANMSAYERMSANPNLWQLEKNQMQSTILTLSEEVEYLSVKNQKMLQDLRRKDSFYETYVKTTDELTKLRQAHTILISLIKTNKLNIGKKDVSSSDQKGDSITDRLLGSSTVDKHELQVPVNN